ncbi:MAG: dephospho-CoA kinase [Burkholderiales bacterium]|jgi:dephospho-CoA kinase|nr:dephospho-CoA kinase [Burkholderiales bacterium]
MRKLGLTGGIGSGKSTVARMLAAAGAALIDADANARSVTASGGLAIQAIRDEFGAEFVGADGSLDRTRMRALAFETPAARQRLEAIIHPLVGLLGEQQLAEAARAGHRCAVFDIPLLVESGRWRARLDHVLVVDCTTETQVERVVARSGLEADAVRAIITAQATRAERLAAADAVIFNEGITLDELHLQVRAVSERFGL